MDPLPAHLHIEAIHGRLCRRIAELRPPVVADVINTFLEVSSLPCVQRLWSLEFAFDEDDGRIALIEARFVDRSGRDPVGGELRGYEVQLLLPKVIPARAPADGQSVAEHGLAMAATDGALVSRFVRALADLGAYRTIERLEAVTVETCLL
jgi:hypothetical protein